MECNKESNGFGSKSNGNKGSRRLTLTRAMATVMATTWATKKARVRAARAMATVMRVAGNEEGNGDGGKSNGDGNKGGGQVMATATKMVMVTATRVGGKQRQRQ